jgi:hypothetical protein
VVSRVELLGALVRAIDANAAQIAEDEAYYDGRSPMAFLSPEARTALGTRLRALSVGFPRLVVDSLNERLNIVGFRDGEPGDPYDSVLWEAWQANDMENESVIATAEALTVGRSFVTVWAGADGSPSVSVESARQMAVARDPMSWAVVAAVKRWSENGTGYAVLYEPTRITSYRSEATVAGDWTAVPAHAWNVAEVLPNPLGVVPVVPLVNRVRLTDEGVSEMAAVRDLSDAATKLLTDMLVSSEFHAMPRRWVTGLEIQEDEDGQPINPFSSEAQKIWQSESPETRFGQFDAARLDGYTSAIATITQTIGAMSGLPPHYLGLNGDHPTSADAIRSAEASLVARARAKQRMWTPAWAQVGRLIVAVRDGVDPRSVRVEPVWANPETRTVAQAADAAAKLVQAGILPVAQALDDLGYSPTQIENMQADRRAEALDRAGVDLKALLP